MPRVGHWAMLMVEIAERRVKLVYDFDVGTVDVNQPMRGYTMIPIPLDEMSVEEKLQTMELIWEDLCRNEANVPSPAWHGEVLHERDTALKSGKTELEDWELAKRRILGEIG